MRRCPLTEENFLPFVGTLPPLVVGGGSSSIRRLLGDLLFQRRCHLMVRERPDDVSQRKSLRLIKSQCDLRRKTQNAYRVHLR